MEHKNIMQAQLMQSHIEACKESSLTVRAYCLEHQIKSSNYYYWQNKLQLPAPGGKFIPVTPLLSTVPVSITFTNGKRISFETMPPVEYVKQLMS